MAKPMVEKGVVVGNVYDKHNTRNPLVRWIMRGFYRELFSLMDSVPHLSIHEVGCGEGYLLAQIIKRYPQSSVIGSDISPTMIEVARGNLPPGTTLVEKSIYQLTEEDSAQMVVASEVLEHLDDPLGALEVLSRIASPYCLLSVPREPIWRIMNMARGKYLRHLGNTPGHVNHWSTSALCNLVSEYFELQEIRTPIPFSIVLCRSRVKGG
jgi:trans-aconitate methyltransferase